MAGNNRENGFSNAKKYPTLNLAVSVYNTTMNLQLITFCDMITIRGLAPLSHSPDDRNVNLELDFLSSAVGKGSKKEI